MNHPEVCLAASTRFSWQRNLRLLVIMGLSGSKSVTSLVARLLNGFPFCIFCFQGFWLAPDSRFPSDCGHGFLIRVPGLHCLASAFCLLSVHVMRHCGELRHEYSSLLVQTQNQSPDRDTIAVYRFVSLEFHFHLSLLIAC